jgi:hypothetical protein
MQVHIASPRASGCHYIFSAYPSEPPKQLSAMHDVRTEVCAGATTQVCPATFFLPQEATTPTSAPPSATLNRSPTPALCRHKSQDPTDPHPRLLSPRIRDPYQASLSHYTRRSRSPALVNCPLVVSETRHRETKRNIFCRAEKQQWPSAGTWLVECGDHYARDCS